MTTKTLRPKRVNPFMKKVDGKWKFKENFVGILQRIYKHPQFPHRSCVVYLCILEHCRRKDWCFLLRKTIANELHLKVWTVDEHLNALVNAGFIRKRHRPGCSTVFVLRDPDIAVERKRVALSK